MFYCAPFSCRLRFVLHDYVSVHIVIHVVWKVGFQTCLRWMTLLLDIYQKTLDLLHYYCMWNYIVSWYFVRKLETLDRCFLFLVLYYVVCWLYCTYMGLTISAKRYRSRVGVSLSINLWHELSHEHRISLNGFICSTRMKSYKPRHLWGL